MRVLIVDDSVAFRSQIRRAITAMPGMEVIGTASNGKIALQMLDQRQVDLMTLDLNMPEMTGLELLAHLKEHPRPGLKVLVFAASTARAARDTLQALRLGADDFVVKPQAATTNIDTAYEMVQRELAPKIEQFRASKAPGLGPTEVAEVSTSSAAKPLPRPPLTLDTADFSAIVIASSTGGPSALEALFTVLGTGRSPLTSPILIAQHMPPVFTKHLAERLSRVSNRDCREGEHGEAVTSGRVYMAPGNMHMRVARDDHGIVRIILDQTPRVNGVRPAADLLFEAAAAVYDHRCLGMVLTGMGEDGAAGAASIKAAGGRIVIQDEATCVVWGMPRSVFISGHYDAQLSLDDCAKLLLHVTATREAA